MLRRALLARYSVMPTMPAGSYTLTVETTDARGRSRERRVEFEVRE